MDDTIKARTRAQGPPIFHTPPHSRASRSENKLLHEHNIHTVRAHPALRTSTRAPPARSTARAAKQAEKLRGAWSSTHHSCSVGGPPFEPLEPLGVTVCDWRATATSRIAALRVAVSSSAMLRTRSSGVLPSDSAGESGLRRRAADHSLRQSNKRGTLEAIAPRTDVRASVARGERRGRGCGQESRGG